MNKFLTFLSICGILSSSVVARPVHDEFTQPEPSTKEYLTPMVPPPNKSEQDYYHPRDPCSGIGLDKDKLIPVEQVAMCLQSFPTNKEIKQEIVSNIRKMVSLYVYKDLTEPDLTKEMYSKKINITKELNRIEAETYTKDIDFHNDMMDTFVKLNDAHTEYASSCYHTWTFYQPWSFVSVVDQNTNVQKIVIKRPVFTSHEKNEVWYPYVGVDDLNLFVNWSVVEINGVNAVDAILEFAKTEVGTSRDLMVRFNKALGRQIWRNGTMNWRYGEWSARRRIPDSAVVTYTLESPDGSSVTTVHAPFLASLPPSTFANSEEYWKKLCLRNSTTGIPTGFEKDPIKLMEFEHHHLTHEKEYPIEPEGLTTTNDNSETEEPRIENVEYLSNKLEGRHLNQTSHQKYNNVTFAPDYVVYYLKDNVTAVFKLSTFKSVNSTKTIAEWSKVLTKIKNNGVKNLILDVSDNVGGLIYLNFALAKALFPSTSPYIMDSVSSPLLKTLIYQAAEKRKRNSTFYYKDRIVSATTNREFSGPQEYAEGPFLDRHGVQQQYTSPMRFNYVNSTKIKIDGSVPTTPVWPASNVAILSNGLCGSSCSMFTSALKEENQVRQFVLGGISGKPMSVNSYAGGQVYHARDLIRDVQNLGFAQNNSTANNIVPAVSKGAYSFSFTLREAYSKAYPQRVLELTYTPATDRLDYNLESYNDPSIHWNQIVQKMKW